MYTILGSNKVIDFKSDLDIFFNGEFIVDPRNKTKMEMDAHSLYCLAKHLGRNDVSTKVIKGIIANLEGDVFWKHNAWGYDETHLRFTSAALRLVLDPDVMKEFQKNSINIENLLHKHFSYNDKLDRGLFFLHDSIELMNVDYPSPHIKKSLSENKNNLFVYNTHFDTLITLLMFQKYSTYDLKNEIHKGLIGLDFILENVDDLPKFWNKLDSFIRAVNLRNAGRNSFIRKVFYKVVNELYYKRVRKKLKRNYNIFTFSDGFLERDMCQLVANYHYHAVNIWDISRLLMWLQIGELDNEFKSTSLLKEILQRGVKYSMSDEYVQYALKHRDPSFIICHLLECYAICFTLNLNIENLQETYISFRKTISPTPGLLGIDYTMSGIDCFKDKILIKIRQDNLGLDVIRLANGKLFLANFSTERIILDNEIFTCNLAPGKVVVLDY